jgi:outer membrane protein assembly factor BamB
MMFLMRPLAALLLVGGLAAWAGTATAGDFISVELLSDAGIQTVWQDGLPLKEQERLASVNLLGDGVYALSSTNYLFAFNASTGAHRFADRIAAPGLDLLPLQRNNGTLRVMAGSSMTGFDATTGKEQRKLSVPFGVVAIPAANDTHYYLAADDGKVYAYDASDRVLAFRAAADQGSLMTNLAATNECVVFTTNKGAVVAMEPDKPALKWRYDSPGAIKGRIVLDGGELYLSSMDTNVYKFDAATGRILWNYMAGAQLDSGPCVTASVVYQFAGDNGVYALDKKTGKVLWQVKDARGLLAEQKGTAYLMGRDQSLIVVDNATGRRIREVNMPGVDIYASNVIDGMIYVGSAATGKVACLKPTEQ